MSDTSGYILYLSSGRYKVLESYGSINFAQPVTDFLHSRHKPLVCFITNESGVITHFGFGRKGLSAGTELRRLNVNDIVTIRSKVTLNEIVNLSGNRYKSHLKYQIKTGGLITPKCFGEFLRIFLDKIPEAKYILNKYSKDRWLRIEKLSSPLKKSLAEQKEAILTAMNIAGIDKHKILGWDCNDNEAPSSFLDGLENIKLREDSMIINDLHNLPGFDLIKTTKFSSAVFMNDTSHLTILLANRMPLEELLGTDLIYFNEDFNCFVMVQYKVMEKEKNNSVFRLPNAQFDKEISRMEIIGGMLNNYKNTGSIDDFRFDSYPFFIKICPRMDFEPDNAGLSNGMYLPLNYFKILQNEESIKGSNGGKAISYKNVRRYLNNTSFKTIIEGAWIGTCANQSEVLKGIIRSTLENGKAVVYAINRAISSEEMNKKYEDNFQDLKDDYDNFDQDDLIENNLNELPF